MSEAVAEARPRPVIVCCMPDHDDVIVDELGRYARDYEVRCAPTADGVTTLLTDAVAAGEQVCLIVSESRLPDAHLFEAFGRWRELVPTAKRLVVSHWNHFLDDAPGIRPALAKGKMDAHLLLPRGVRDEEFHHVITEMLSDWGSTVPDPEAVNVKVVAPANHPLAMGIVDLLDRMGMPNRRVTRTRLSAATSSGSGRSSRTSRSASRWCGPTSAASCSRARCATSPVS